VKSIGQYAFSDCLKLRTINIPKKVSHIKRRTFLCCTALESVTFPEGLREIGEEAFGECVNLKAVKFPSSLRRLGPRCFSNCSSLTSVTVPEGVTCIGKRAFQGNQLRSISLPASLKDVEASFVKGPVLQEVHLSEENPYLKIENGVLFTKDGKKLLVFLLNTKTRYEIPEGVTHIADEALNGITNLTVLSLPDSVTYIGDYAFMHCWHLENIRLSSNLTHIGKEAFRYTGLQKLNVPASVQSIGDDAFKDIAKIGKNVFQKKRKPFTICALQDSFAIEYAKKNCIPYEIWNEE